MRRRRSNVIFILLVALLCFGGVIAYDHWPWHTHATKVAAVAPSQSAPRADAPRTPVAQAPVPVPRPTVVAQAAPLPPAKRSSRLVVKPRVKRAPVDVPWTNWGAAPFASSFTEACRRTPEMIDRSSLPEPVKALLKREIGPNCAGGEERWLTPSQHLNQMASGGQSGGYFMTEVTVARLPVAKAPDGRTYRQGSVFETAHAQAWRVEYDGQAYVWFIPDVCFNVGWFIETPRERCVEVDFNATPGGEIRWGIGSINGPLPPSACNAQSQGDEPKTAYTGICDACTGNIRYLSEQLGGKAETPHKYRYPVRAVRQRIFFSTAVWEKSFYVCKYEPDGTSTCGVYIHPRGPSPWDHRYRVEILDSMWRKDDGSCPH